MEIWYVSWCDLTFLYAWKKFVVWHESVSYTIFDCLWCSWLILMPMCWCKVEEPCPLGTIRITCGSRMWDHHVCTSVLDLCCWPVLNKSIPLFCSINYFQIMQCLFLPVFLRGKVACNKFQWLFCHFMLHKCVFQVNPSDVIILEGILIFHDPRVRELMNMKIFVDTGPLLFVIPIWFIEFIIYCMYPVASFFQFLLDM